ncbi:hypothetical protein PFISCL1PPCAC_28569 [Pristionchus fissidentatus]|uniref:Uncharacterized protein n=1 Tax=Pristionchus fissidentatus TaxID=1538716 RepID=A0AAV5W8L1_9BILA|nr:hypothetical protein PFISCL1PPCAC_18438 [Pristionchus fissidentatus]GMT37272.1 hypothetical protein PFISCL1PPCAC_28569 [Pristionchus fissidentatus]
MLVDAYAEDVVEESSRLLDVGGERVLVRDLKDHRSSGRLASEVESVYGSCLTLLHRPSSSTVGEYQKVACRDRVHLRVVAVSHILHQGIRRDGSCSRGRCLFIVHVISHVSVLLSVG